MAENSRRICDFRFMSHRFIENDDYRKNWLYQAPNSKFAFNYSDVAYSIYSLIQTTSIVDYKKWIRTYERQHPEFNLKDANDREEFYDEVRTIILEIVDAFFHYSDPGFCWGIDGEEYSLMNGEELDDRLNMQCWKQALTELSGSQTDGISFDAIINFAQSLTDQHDVTLIQNLLYQHAGTNETLLQCIAQIKPAITPTNVNVQPGATYNDIHDNTNPTIH